MQKFQALGREMLAMSDEVSGFTSGWCFFHQPAQPAGSIVGEKTPTIRNYKKREPIIN